MNARKPIFTEPAECQDCYKCVRSCPVKAIRVQHGHASVEPETCIFCGTCVGVCPAHAKKVRKDLPRARQLLLLRERVYVSLAPSFVAEFSEYTPGQLNAALRDLGFAGVSETALGAEAISTRLRDWFHDSSSDSGVRISTACPVVVDLVTKYYPHLSGLLSEEPSPMLAHAAQLRRRFGDDIGIVFIGPCIAKKCESDANGDLLEVAITFDDLRLWLSHRGVDPGSYPADTAANFALGESGTCRSYPIDGGMIATLALQREDAFNKCVHLSGLSIIQQTLEELEADPSEPGTFLELLACEGGCINGPGTRSKDSLLKRRRRVLSFTPANRTRRKPETNSLPQRWVPEPFVAELPEDWQIREALLAVGKRTKEEELNCGGCGYDSCHSFAKALVVGRAEPAMCVAYMRRLAQKKNSALLKTIPSAAVTVDSNLRIVESNRNFATLCGAEAESAYDALPGLEGAYLERFLPMGDLFRAVLHSGGEILDKTIRLPAKTIVNASLFSIEEHHLVGAILQDITAPAMQKQQIVEKSKEVIDKNLKTVQQIAFLLGENASETELILNSIVRSFSGEGEAR